MRQNQVDILLIEDNQDEAELTIRCLKKNNILNNVMHIDDGAEALDFIYSTGKYDGNNKLAHPRLILLDLNLPKVNGLEILRKLKYDDTTMMIPVVVLTSSKEESDIVKSYRLGVNSYIVKPVNFEAFTQAIVELKLYWLLLNQQPQQD